jgi:signal transduction histidine kinase
VDSPDGVQARPDPAHNSGTFGSSLQEGCRAKYEVHPIFFATLALVLSLGPYSWQLIKRSVLSRNQGGCCGDMARMNPLRRKRQVRSADGDPIFKTGLEADEAPDLVRRLTGRLLHAEEDERRRLARELHDGLCQTLAMVNVELGTVLSRIPAPARATRRQLRNIRDRVEQISEEVRRISHRLHPAVLDRLGLTSALRSYCSEFSNYHHIRVLFVDDGPDEPFPFEIAACLYRIAQEALQNVARYAKAKTVWVALNRRPGETILSVVDDGQGFDLLQVNKKSGLGLISMEERARLAGGTLSIESRPGAGTRIDAILPSGRVHE